MQKNPGQLHHKTADTTKWCFQNKHYVTTLYLFYKITPLDQGCLLTTVKLKVKKKNEIKNNENKYLSNSTLIIRKQGK